MQTQKRLPIGISDFKKLVEGGYYLVDKSPFISEVIESSGEIILLPRPRRFGKTLNLSMLRYFFEKVEDKAEAKRRRALFEGLKVLEDSESLEHLGKYPVIFLTFKDVKEAGFDRAFFKIRSLVREEYEKHAQAIKRSGLTPMEEREMERLLLEEAEQPLVENSLKRLSKLLHDACGIPPLILLDEYDTPIHAAWVGGYYDEMIGFMRNLLSGAFKDNPYIFKGIVTGVLRVARESIFSGLNNLDVRTILDERFSDKFGFTIDEVKGLLEEYSLFKRFDEVNEWYNGYRFGETTIFNPWSIINFLDKKKPRPYWANTSSNDILKELIVEGGVSLRADMEKLIRGGTIESRIDENIVFPELKGSRKYIYSLLFFSGYLKCEEQRFIDDTLRCILSIPNREVRYIYREIISSWIEDSFENEKLNLMLRALIDGNIELFSRLLNEFVLTTLSYFDAKGKNPEAVFQAFILGMLLNLGNEYEITSNRELGYGRYDVLVLPKDRKRPAIIMEMKSIAGFYEEEPEKAIKDALKQIEDRGYDKELSARGYGHILRLAVVSDGKKVWVKEGRQGPRDA
ncbi:MAG TPA: AAA family ATPase [Dissulfuribacter thermophilus]|uniref:AAA family ATPase n=1 Tax=Dissulfuribacter thermophilus TaxID=1156395 RepID=A0A7V2SYR2_9BACT|nr:AAA family ATPase [Dissulfuribacter thermophilus]